MTICPFMSSQDGVLRCHPSCALLTTGGCAIKVLAEAQIRTQQSNSEPPVQR